MTDSPTTASPANGKCTKSVQKDRAKGTMPGESLVLKRAKLDESKCCLKLDYITMMHTKKIQQHHATINNMARKVCMVEIAGSIYWADTVTGTLFKPDGTGKSTSQLRMKIGVPV